MKKGMYKILVYLSCFCLCMSFFIVPVKAESDIYYPNPYSYNAYDYFLRNGYNDLILSTSGNTTYSVNLDNIGTNNGTITGTDDLSGSSHNTGTINSTSSTLGSKYLTCTTNNAVSGTQTYSCYFSNVSYGQSNSQSITLKMNENTYSDYSSVDVNVNETINQRINTDITGTITASSGTSHYVHLPWIKGTYVESTGYDVNKRVLVNNSDRKSVYMIFYTKERISWTVNLTKYPTDEVTYSYNFKDIPFGFMYLNILHINGTGGQGYLSFSFNNLGSKDVLPIFYGYEYAMPDEVAEMIGIRKSVGYILNNGSDNSSNVINNGLNAKEQVSQKIGEFDNIENNSVNDMNNNISNLNLTSDILSNSKFLSSAQWVKTQFDRMTVSTPIGSVLSFSLILGMTLIFLGKLR